MTTKKEIRFEKNLPFHISSRAVDGRKIFEDEADKCRFIFQMYAANVGRPAFNLHRQDINKAAYAILNGEEPSSKFVDIQHPPFVSFLSFALAFDHHHLCLVQNIDNGVSKYLQKLHGGFARYFNIKYKRKDTLFERQYSIVPIKSDLELAAVIRYINIKNPLDVYQPNWQDTGLKGGEDAFNFLVKYQFSNFPDLAGKRNSDIFLVLKQFFGKGKEIGATNKLEFVAFVKDYIQGNLTAYNKVFLEE